MKTHWKMIRLVESHDRDDDDRAYCLFIMFLFLYNIQFSLVLKRREKNMLATFISSEVQCVELLKYKHRLSLVNLAQN